MERPIGPMLRNALANSALLAATSIVLVAVVGVALGVVAAIKHNSPLDHGISVFTLARHLGARSSSGASC